MAEIQIKTESFPLRCEICHQTDCFDARRNYCSRCETTDVVCTKPLNVIKSDDKLIINVKLDLSDFTQAYEEHFAQECKVHNKLYKISRIGPSFLLGGYFIILTWASLKWGISYALYNTPLIMIISPLLVLLLPKIGNLLGFRMLKSFQKDRKYTFLYDGFMISNEKSFSNINWESLHKVVETKHNFIFFITRRESQVIPKKCFNHPYEIKGLKEILKAKLGNKAKLTSD